MLSEEHSSLLCPCINDDRKRFFSAFVLVRHILVRKSAVNVVKLLVFSFLLTERPNKLDRFPLANLSCLFASKAEAYPCGEPFMLSPCK